MYNSILFIGIVQRIISEEHYMDTEEKLSFFMTFFLIKEQKHLSSCIILYRTEKNVHSSPQIFVEIIKL